MAAPKISIIVPVYKAEATICKCLDSILAQTMTDWETILVDDGSTDRSGSICDAYATNDCRFRVIHKQNGGVSAARQTGIDNVTGVYIIHVDPDDWIEPIMLEELYAKATADNADMVICDFYCDIEEKSYYRQQKPTTLQREQVLNDMFGLIHGSCCNKLVKKSAILASGAKFPCGINYCEDVCFNTQLLLYEIKVTYINKAFYHYVQHYTSITNSYNQHTFESQIKYVIFLSTLLPETSAPIIHSKELVKKNAFRNNLLSNKELVKLYPEITNTHDNNPLLQLMYNLAFRGHDCLAKILLTLYKLKH